MLKYGILLVSVFSALLLRVFIVSVYKVPSQSMAPQLLAGDFVIASQLAYQYESLFARNIFSAARPKAGDLVVYLKNSKIFIRRILAVGADSFEMNLHVLTVNSKDCIYSSGLSLEFQKDITSHLLMQTETCGLSSRLILQTLEPLGGPLSWANTTLSKNQYLVASDNRTRENNPELLEIINYDQILGKPQLIWMSYSSTQDFISNITGVRWNRILTKLN